jgi:hypothetical protein
MVIGVVADSCDGDRDVVAFPPMREWSFKDASLL